MKYHTIYPAASLSSAQLISADDRGRAIHCLHRVDLDVGSRNSHGEGRYMGL